MKRDLGLTLTVIVGMATFAIALVAGIFLIWGTSASAIAQESQPSQRAQVTLLPAQPHRPPIFANNLTDSSSHRRNGAEGGTFP